MAFLRAAVGVVLILVLVSPAPAVAEDLRHKRDQARQQQQALQVQIDLAKASDTKVEAEAARLTAAVSVQQARVEDARQAESAAAEGVTRATQKLADLQLRSTGARQQLVETAVNAYVNAGQTASAGAGHTTDSMTSMMQRQAYVELAESRTTDLLDTIRAAHQDELTARADLERARNLARDRAAAEARQADQLATAQKAQQTAHAALQARIGDLQTESVQLAAQEGQIETLIRQQDAAAAQALAAQRAAAERAAAERALASRQMAPSVRAPANLVSRGGSSGAGLIWPVSGPVTSEFGPRWGGFHPGIDIAPSYGTPIAAAKAGVVIYAQFNDGGYGNLVIIDHGDGMATAYAHQSQLAVTQGQTVSQGQVIGYVGSTGYSTGPHLHFEVRVNGSPQNPRNYENGSP